MTRTVSLTESAHVTLDGQGNGTASVAPLSPGEQWSGMTVSVLCTGGGEAVYGTTYQAVYPPANAFAEATCAIYAGAAPTAGYFADATTWGSTGDATTNAGPVRVGGAIWAVWAGGNPGAAATLIVRGERTVS